MNQTIKEIALAIRKKQTYYKGIKLPLPQKCGTLSQGRMYSKMAAEKIYKQYFQGK